VENDLGRHALLDEVLEVLGSERRVAAEESVGDDTHRPHIYGLTVSLLKHDLGRRVAERPRHRGEDLVLAIQHLGDTEIGKDQVGVGSPCKVEEVFRFEI